jgi:ABC-type transport system substrate-binding protein
MFILLTLLLTCWQSSLLAEKVFWASEDGAPIGLDPVRASTKYANVIVTSVFDTLYEYKYLKSPFELKPSLAVALPKVSEDGLTYTIDIKSGVFFQDDAAFPGGKGREVVAEDIVYSLKRHFDKTNKSQGSWLWRGRIVGLDDWGKTADYSATIEGFKATGKYQLQIKLVKPFPQLTYTLAMGFAAAMAKEVVDHYGKEIALHPVGSGPFILKSFNTQKATLLRNPNYRDDYMDLEGYREEEHGKYGVQKLKGKKLPIVDRVEFQFIKEKVARWNSLTKGNETQIGTLLLEMENQVLASKSPEVTLKPEWAEKYHYMVETEPGFVYNNFNMEHPKIGYSDDPKINEQNRLLRCAIRKGFNWNERIKRFYRGLGSAFPGVVLRNIDGWDETLSTDSITYDPEEAKRLLAQGGWNARNLPVLEYNNTTSARSKQFFEQFRGWMKKIGYPTQKIRNKTYATFGDFSKALANKEGMFWGIGWGLDYPDAENTLQLWYGPNESPGSNAANYKNPEYDRLYDLSSTMQPSPERTKIYKKMNQILINDCVNISGFSRTNIFMWHKNVTLYYRRDIIGSKLKYVDVM